MPHQTAKHVAAPVASAGSNASLVRVRNGHPHCGRARDIRRATTDVNESGEFMLAEIFVRDANEETNQTREPHKNE